MHLFEMLLAALFASIGTFFAYHGVQHCIACVRMFRAGQPAEGTVAAMKPALQHRKGRTWISYTAVYSRNWHKK